LSRKSTKALIQDYEKAEEEWKVPEIDSVLEKIHEEPEPEPEVKEEPSHDSAQRTLF
jgi:hypothetical protein